MNQIESPKYGSLGVIREMVHNFNNHNHLDSGHSFLESSFTVFVSKNINSC